jgi:hypothetical protein
LQRPVKRLNRRVNKALVDVSGLAFGLKHNVGTDTPAEHYVHAHAENIGQGNGGVKQH